MVHFDEEEVEKCCPGLKARKILELVVEDVDCGIPSEAVTDDEDEVDVDEELAENSKRSLNELFCKNEPISSPNETIIKKQRTSVTQQRIVPTSQRSEEMPILTRIPVNGHRIKKFEDFRGKSQRRPRKAKKTKKVDRLDAVEEAIKYNLQETENNREQLNNLQIGHNALITSNVFLLNYLEKLQPVFMKNLSKMAE